MKTLHVIGLLGAATSSLAFPRYALEYAERMKNELDARQAVPGLPGGFTAPPLTPPGFDAKAQFIDVSGKNKWVAPGPNDQRGVCPGLNALANHNFIPHNGVATITQFIDATNKVYGMGLDLAAFLAIYGAVFDGDLTSWSIGGPTNQNLPLGLLSQPRGLTGSHNKYEADASPTRGDLYLYGNNFDARLDQWEQMYALQSDQSNEAADYNLNVLTPFRNDRVLDSRERNPYFFNGPFPGVLVQPAAYTFIWRFMANHSADYPEGRLNKDVLKSFFAFTGEPGSFAYHPGHERIPDNWYRRAFGDEYSIPYFLADVVLAAKTYPIFLQVGGNTGEPDTFTGVDTADLTGGVFESATLLEGNNLACYVFQGIVQQSPDLLFNLVGNVLSKAISQIDTAVGNVINNFGCPQLSYINDGPLSQFPGYTKLNNATGTYN